MIGGMGRWGDGEDRIEGYLYLCKSSLAGGISPSHEFICSLYFQIKLFLSFITVNELICNINLPCSGSHLALGMGDGRDRGFGTL